MHSLYVNEICGSVEEDASIRRMPGEILTDTGYAVIAGTDAADGEKYQLQKLDSPDDIRAVIFTTPDGKRWHFAANFGESPVVWQEHLIKPCQCELWEK